MSYFAALRSVFPMMWEKSFACASSAFSLNFRYQPVMHTRTELKIVLGWKMP